jgi:hypothetical protein
MAPSRSAKRVAIPIAPDASRSCDQVFRVPQLFQGARRQGCVSATAPVIVMLFSVASPGLTEIYLT